jgi:hypothetical protein
MQQDSQQNAPRIQVHVQLEKIEGATQWRSYIEAKLCNGPPRPKAFLLPSEFISSETPFVLSKYTDSFRFLPRKISWPDLNIL